MAALVEETTSRPRAIFVIKRGIGAVVRQAPKHMSRASFGALLQCAGTLGICFIVYQVTEHLTFLIEVPAPNYSFKRTAAW